MQSFESKYWIVVSTCRCPNVSHGLNMIRWVPRSSLSSIRILYAFMIMVSVDERPCRILQFSKFEFFPKYVWQIPALMKKTTVQINSKLIKISTVSKAKATFNVQPATNCLILSPESFFINPNTYFYTIHLSLVLKSKTIRHNLHLKTFNIILSVRYY